MAEKNKKRTGNSLIRLALVAVAFLVQVGWLIVQAKLLNNYSQSIALLTNLLTIVVILRLNGKHINSAMKIAWILLIMAFPFMGLCLYLLFVILGDPGMGKRLRAIRTELAHTETAAFERLEQKDLALANQSRYLCDHVGYPVYENTAVRYYGEAKDAFEDLKRDLQKAEKFIFMEYFIIADGSAFREIEQILVEKARQGVEIRLMYDDIGSVGYVNMAFAKKLNAEGIKCMPFNPAFPVLNLFLNHRDHRKATIIDGKVGFTGGYNLSDEYFDRTHPYGKWKDTGLRLEGEAVRSLTAIFLELWKLQTRDKEDVGKYLDICHRAAAEGFVQPFADDPLGKERVAENVYLNLTNLAQKSLYFTTPYLIITDEMNRALGLAAMRGVDVRIITPGVPDKKTIYAVTRSYYAGLARQGVRIFEYTPGFCHAKQCVCDGKIATVGTSNLDYRSLYHHFENNVLLSGCDAVGDIAADFDSLFPQCREVTDQYRSGRGAALRTWQYIHRLFAPLL